MKKITALYITLLAMILIPGDSSAAVRRMMGPNMTSSWASSYLSIQSNSVSVQDNPTWTHAVAPGLFLDYLVTPYISIRSNYFFYPASLNNNFKDFGRKNGQILLHEFGFSVIRHFNAQPFNPWFGAGPFLQLVSIDDVNSYILHAVVSIGFDYEMSEGVFFCPEFMAGIGASLFSSSEEQSVVIDVPGANDFTSSGIVIFLKIGIGKSF